MVGIRSYYHRRYCFFVTHSGSLHHRYAPNDRSGDFHVEYALRMLVGAHKVSGVSGV
jgi:hypothetical protein